MNRDVPGCSPVCVAAERRVLGAPRVALAAPQLQNSGKRCRVLDKVSFSKFPLESEFQRLLVVRSNSDGLRRAGGSPAPH